MTTAKKATFGSFYREIGKFMDTSTSKLVKTVNGLVAAMVDGTLSVQEAFRETFFSQLGEILTVSDLVGRMSTLKTADGAAPPGMSVAETGQEEPPGEFTIQIANVPFHEAIADIVAREPRLATNAVAIAELYARKHAFAMAKSTDLVLTKRVQEEIGRMLNEGFSSVESGEVVARMGGWTQAYGETVFRTNAATAFTAGQFAQVYDPDVADLIPAFEYNAVRDSSVRHNHLAADGLVAGTRDSIWDVFSPPMGYACRCSLRFVDKYELEERGLLDKVGRVRQYRPPTFARAHPDPNFGMGRPDRLLYMRG